MNKYVAWTMAGIASFGVSLVAMTPLPFVLGKVQEQVPDVQMAGASGTVWNGSVASVQTPLLQLHDVAWRVTPMALLKGQLAADVELAFSGRTGTGGSSGGRARGDASGRCGVSVTTAVQCSGVQLDAPAALVKSLPNTALVPALQGDLRLELASLDWDRESLPQMEGNGMWQAAQLGAPMNLDLQGDYLAEISPTDDGGLDVLLDSVDTLVGLSGDVAVDAAGVYQVNAKLKPTAEASGSVRQGLTFVGQVQKDGSVIVKQDGQIF